MWDGIGGRGVGRRSARDENLLDLRGIRSYNDSCMTHYDSHFDVRRKPCAN